MIDLKQLTAFYPFNQLSKNDLNSLLRYIKVVSYRKGKYINYQGDKLDNFYFVLDGVVSLYRWANDEKEVLVKDIIIGEWLNISELFNGELIYYDSRAKTDLTVIKFNSSSLEILLNNSIINRSLIHDIARWNNHYYKKANQSTCYTSLLEFIENSNSMEITITQNKLSEKLGYTRESVNKNLKKLEDEGVIKLERGKILVNPV